MKRNFRFFPIDINFCFGAIKIFSFLKTLILCSSFQSLSILVLMDVISSAVEQALRTASQTEEVQEWTKRIKLWLKELSVFQQLFLNNQHASDDLLGVDQLSDTDLPIWLAAQRAVSRYEGILSPVGPRGRLLRKLLSWSGLIPPTPETPHELDSDSNAPELYKRLAPVKSLSPHNVAVVVYFLFYF